jgi:hypothetical protein
LAPVTRRASEVNWFDSESERNAVSGVKGAAAAQMGYSDTLLVSLCCGANSWGLLVKPPPTLFTAHHHPPLMLCDRFTTCDSTATTFEVNMIMFSTRRLLPAVAGLAAILQLLGARPTGAGEGADVFAYGTVDLRLSVNDRQALEGNRQRRGNSPFSHINLNLFADIVANERLTVFNHVLVDPAAATSIGSFLRSWVRYTAVVRPGFDLHLQMGKIPTPFGHFTERAYTDINPVLGYPLMYHYSSSLRKNQLPASNSDLLAHRGQGTPAAFTGYDGSSAGSSSGLPMIYDSCWDFGGSAVGSLWRFEYLAAVTLGSLSDPRANASDNNDGRQLAVRLGLVPFTGLLLRTSYARAPYLDRVIASGLAPGEQVEDFRQEIIGVSAEYEWRHLSVIGEWADNRWESPNIHDGNGASQDLKVTGFYLEGRYKLQPGWFVGGRYSGLRYGRIDDGSGSRQSIHWDFDVDRLEIGSGYWVTDVVLTKLTAQINRVGDPQNSRHSILGTQLTIRF